MNAVARSFLVLALLGLLLGTADPAAAQGRSAEVESLEEQSFKQAAALVSASMVKIETVGGLDRIGQVLTGTGPTTGVIVSSDGYILSSSFNFAAKPASILITLPDGRRQTAEQVAVDRARMLTLLKTDATGLIPAVAAPPESFRVGQWSLALGKTFDEDLPSISVGIVSALRRIWGKAIQTDAKVSPANYGGPLVDIEGRVLGILVPLSPQASGEVAGVEWYDSGIGFAIPLADAYQSLERLKQGKDLLSGLMGVSFKGANIYDGAPTVDRVRYNSPAYEAGIKSGDIIIQIDGKPVARQAQLRHLLGNKYAGEEVTVTVKRGEEQHEYKLTLVGELQAYETPFLGILPERPVPDQMPVTGLGVRSVVPDSPAAKAGLMEGDRIVKVGDTEISTAATLLEPLTRVRPGEKLKLSVRTGEEAREVEITLGSFPENVPEELRSVLVPVPDKAAVPADLKLGRFTDRSEAHEHDYWAYVPPEYHPEYPHALMVWIHPGGDTMEAAMIKEWETVCAQRGIIMLGPKAREISGWQPNEEEFVQELTKEFTTKYNIDSRRVFLHSFSKGGPFAYNLAFKFRDLYRGIAVAGAPLLAEPPENQAEQRLQFYLICGQKDPQYALVERTAAGLRNLKYPVVFQTLPDVVHTYPEGAALDEMARWIDSLDRL